LHVIRDSVVCCCQMWDLSTALELANKCDSKLLLLLIGIIKSCIDTDAGARELVRANMLAHQHWNSHCQNCNFYLQWH